MAGTHDPKTREQYLADYAWLIAALEAECDEVQGIVSPDGRGFRVLVYWRRPDPTEQETLGVKGFTLHVENPLTGTSLNGSIAMHHSQTRESVVANIVNNSRPKGWSKAAPTTVPTRTEEGTGDAAPSVAQTDPPSGPAEGAAS